MASLIDYEPYATLSDWVALISHAVPLRGI